MPNADATNPNVRLWLKTLLDREWTESIAGRTTDVPKPVIGTAKDIPTISSSELLTEDYLVISSPSGGTREPQGFAYTEERIADRATLDIRTVRQRGGEERLYGSIDPATMQSERYGGVVGEAVRCCQTVRRGEGDYDIVNVIETEPLSGEMGKKTHRATVEVEAIRHVVGVDPSV